MTKDFKIAIEALYTVFSKYTCKPRIEGCSCCVSETDKSQLLSKQLKDLEDEDVSKYTFKAMTTWGDVNDFKHFLPRIFELAATRKLMVDVCVVLEKLNYAKWREWNINEQESILLFLKSWWKFDINNVSYFEPEILIELNKFIQDIPFMLNNWKLNIESQGFKNYVEFVEYYYPELKESNFTFKKLDQYEINTLIKWIEENSIVLEEGFFKYESKDKKLSDRISNTLYMLERIR